MSGDALNPEPKAPSFTPKQWEEWVEQGDGASRDSRLRGAEVLNRINEGLPLSPREEALAKHVSENPAWKEYREYGMDEATIARIMIDNMGTFLVKPESYIGELNKIAQLSDERPPEEPK